MKRILIIKMWALGDLLMATPMIAALRARYPGVQITWVVEATHREILEAHPGIDELIALDSGEWRRFLRKGQLGRWLARSLKLRRQMRERHFDAVINCQPEKWWSAILCAAPIRVGLYPTLLLPSSKRFYTTALNRPNNPPIHNTDHYLMATRALGCPDAGKRLTIGQTASEETYWQDFCDRHPLCPHQPIVLFAPFSNGANRCWEPERYAGLAKRLSQQGMQAVLTYAPGDEKAAEGIAAQSGGCCLLAGKTTLREYISLVRQSDLVVCSDSSAMHIAAAVNTPFVALFGPTPTVERVPLVGEGVALAHSLPCAPCDRPSCANMIFRRCMQLITVDEVQEAAASLRNKHLTR
jgi:heptosyltransferase-1